MADCNACKEKHKAAEPVPYIVHESDMARQERAIKRLWIALILVIVLLVGSNCVWFYYNSQFETVSESTEESYEATVDGGGVAIANGDGEVNYGG